MLPAYLCYRLAAWAAGPERAFPGWSQAFALIPGLTGTYMRREQATTHARGTDFYSGVSGPDFPGYKSPKSDTETAVTLLDGRRLRRYAVGLGEEPPRFWSL